jgi:exosome complex RNA-binding protein Csl4
MKIESNQNNTTSIDDGLICEIDEAEQSFSLRKWFTVSLLLLVTIICGYFALPTTKTVAVSKSVEQVRDGYVTKNIEDIKVGDEVFAYDVTTGKVSKCKVTDTFERTSDHLRYLTVSDSKGTQTFETTDSHPFWVVTDKPDLSRAARDVVEDNGVILRHENIAVTEKGYYVEAKDLKVGDIFIGASGELSTLITTSRKDILNGIKVYNFTVENNHNYFVIANYEAYQNGANVVLVHNAKSSYKTENSVQASSLPVIRKGSKEWKDAVNAIRRDDKVNVRVSNVHDAKALLKEALGNMNRYKQYSEKIHKYSKGYEMHQQFKGNYEGRAITNDLKHIKWKNGNSKGHIFF